VSRAQRWRVFCEQHPDASFLVVVAIAAVPVGLFIAVLEVLRRVW